MTLLEDKVGIVTGAAQGLGEAIARLAAREGSRSRTTTPLWSVTRVARRGTGSPSG